MAEAFVELGAEGVNYVTEKHFDKLYDPISNTAGKLRHSIAPGSPNKNDNRRSSGGAQQQSTYSRQERYNPGYYGDDREYDRAGASAVSGNTQNTRRTHRNRLPSPEGDAYRKENYRDRRRNSSLDRESEYSEQVIGAYQSERDDKHRKAESVLSKKDLKKLRRDSKEMSYGNGYGGGNLATHPQNARSHSQQPPQKTKYYDDDDEYGSDYDDRNGKRYSTTGRGYEDERYDDRPYDREIIETERYRGPARDFEARKQSYGSGRADPYGAGAVTQYRRSTQEVDQYSRRDSSRGRRDKYRDDRDRSRSRSRSRSSSRSSRGKEGGWKGRVDEYFDTSTQGLGVGLAGAIAGGMAGRQFGGKDPRHRNRDIIIGALVGGLGANAAENKWRDYSEEKKEKFDREEGRLESRYEGRDYCRSRSAMR